MNAQMRGNIGYMYSTTTHTYTDNKHTHTHTVADENRSFELLSQADKNRHSKETPLNIQSRILSNSWLMVESCFRASLFLLISETPGLNNECGFTLQIMLFFLNVLKLLHTKDFKLADLTFCFNVMLSEYIKIYTNPSWKRFILQKDFNPSLKKKNNNTWLK